MLLNGRCVLVVGDRLVKRVRSMLEELGVKDRVAEEQTSFKNGSEIIFRGIDGTN